jgi:hypothetical protein
VILDKAEEQELLTWLKDKFNVDTSVEEIEIFGISSTILQKIDDLVEVSERFLMDGSDTKLRLSEIREYFSSYPRVVLEVDTTEEGGNIVQKSGRPLYNWVQAPKLGAEG